MDSLVDSSLVVFNEFHKKELNVQFNNSEKFFDAKRRAILFLNKANYKITETTNSPDFYYNVDSVIVKYSNVERDGLFGDFTTERTIRLKGDYYYKNSNNQLVYSEFNISKKDVINFEDIDIAEEYSPEYLKGEKPAEPFMKTFTESLIFIGAALASVILFFFVRTN